MNDCDNALKYYDQGVAIDPEDESLWKNYLFTNLYVDFKCMLEEQFGIPQFNNSLRLIKKALSMLDSKTILFKVKGFLSPLFKKIIFDFECLNSLDNLNLILEEFNETFKNYDLSAPSLWEIENCCRESSQFLQHKINRPIPS